MTDAEIKECFDGIDFSQMVTADDLFYLIARAVLAAQAAQLAAPEPSNLDIDAAIWHLKGKPEDFDLARRLIRRVFAGQREAK